MVKRKSVSLLFCHTTYFCHPSFLGNAYSQMYLPPNTTPFLQPMEQGIMAT